MKILDVAKAALYGIFLNYYCYYTLTGSFIPGGTMLFLAIAILCVGVDVLWQRRVRMGREIGCWIVYVILAFVSTSLFVLDGSNISYVGDIIKLAQRLSIVMMVAYICEREKSIRFGLRLMAVTAVANAAAVLLVTDDIQTKLGISTSADLSANDVGANMAFGCFAILFAWGRRGRTSPLLWGLKVAGIVACLTVIFLTGSRKSIIAVVIMAGMFLLLCLRDYGKRMNIRTIITVMIVGAVAWMFISENLLPYAEQTNLYTRMLGRGAERTAQSDEGRIQLLRYALEEFAAHPLFGVGFNQFRKLHGNYTHNTYLEPLACSGLLGLLYLYPYYLIIKKQLCLIARNKRGSSDRLKQKELLIYLCMALFVGAGIPYMYKDVPCILLGTFIASQAISFEQLRGKGDLSANY